MKWIYAILATTLIGGPAALAQEESAPPPVPALSVESEPAPAEPAMEPAKDTTMVIINTNLGEIHVKLAADKAPLTVANFLAYVDDGFYNGTIFHRVIDGFMIQGGGFEPNMRQKSTRAPVKNEAANGLHNKRGTIAMARTPVVDSATAQFFINVKDNGFLDFRSPDPQGFGYCVFGEVVAGMDVVDKIKAVRTGTKAGMTDVPLDTVQILSVTRAP
ncbi:MAG: Peptidyl-prolyl cis-trans isomerase B [Verrucomicrobia bacterium ADurb.Bin018]|nr:MAG: Peptidyl-prolyl cis-trans isomerase B [Verrucomicrobia bacterium ADurb.Bin018]